MAYFEITIHIYIMQKGSAISLTRNLRSAFFFKIKLLFPYTIPVHQLIQLTGTDAGFPDGFINPFQSFTT